ncbi:MAG: RNA methyltransferase [Treponema sp.]|jgi:tRNA/rRNA methyltransferase/tRNA (cytidine32/uridine32-2'-O)-methyltransferase|nr:RNA methyltransferase [Treponema sp.]
MRLEDIVIVLARPSEPGNTGAVCRAMKNMGLRRLRLASPEYSDAPEYPGGPAAVSGGPGGPGAPGPAALEKLLARAVHAADIWEGAERFDTLEAALADCAFSAGTSRRRGRRRKSTLTPRELAAFLKTKSGRAAVVFGNERTGLRGEELELCNMASHIPVSPGFPSVNLSHAVQIYAYELYQALAGPAALAVPGRAGSAAMPEGPAAVPGQWTPMTAAEIDSRVRGISAALEAAGFYRHPGRAEQERFLRDLMARAGLSPGEGRYLADIIAKAGRLESLRINANANAG